MKVARSVCLIVLLLGLCVACGGGGEIPEIPAVENGSESVVGVTKEEITFVVDPSSGCTDAEPTTISFYLFRGENGWELRTLEETPAEPFVEGWELGDNRHFVWVFLST